MQVLLSYVILLSLLWSDDSTVHAVHLLGANYSFLLAELHWLCCCVSIDLLSTIWCHCHADLSDSRLKYAKMLFVLNGNVDRKIWRQQWWKKTNRIIYALRRMLHLLLETDLLNSEESTSQYCVMQLSHCVLVHSAAVSTPVVFHRLPFVLCIAVLKQAEQNGLDMVSKLKCFS
jgi:hypothetical protein